MSQPNPLQKYFRQPKIFISLPSKGLYYEPGTLLGDYNNVPIYAMTGMDEILFKTPDALYSGAATVKIIESCCPYIKDASKIPALDIDTLMVAIRIATYGDILSVDKICTECGADNTYEIPLAGIIDHLNSLKFENTLVVDDEMQIRIKPLSYEQMTHYSIENFKLQKTLAQVETLPDDEQQAIINQIFEDLAELQVDLFTTVIESVLIPGQQVSDKTAIQDWLKNSEKTTFEKIKELIDKNRNEWTIPDQKLTCGSCKAVNTLPIVLDQSSFFV